LRSLQNMSADPSNRELCWQVCRNCVTG
jgi:hypothetical protein